MQRRQFLKTAIVATLGLSLAKPATPATELKIGIQTFSLRHLPFEEALKVINGLGVKYIETFEGHLNWTEPPEKLEEAKLLLQKYEINLYAYGVVGLNGDPERNDKIFNFAQTMGIKVITADPEPTAINAINQLAVLSGIRIAIHPHGPEYKRYPGWKKVQQVLSTQPAYYVGICMDVGHVARNGEDPIEGLISMRGIVHGVHFKDHDKKNRPVPLGRGGIDIGGILRTLEQIGYQDVVSLEYEPPDGVDPIPGIKESLKYIHEILGY